MPYYKNEVGRKVRIDLGINLTGSTDVVITVVRPDGISYTKSGSDVTQDDVETGQVSYETVSSDHSQVGTYRAQAKVEGVPNSGDSIRSPFILFEVENIQ